MKKKQIEDFLENECAFRDYEFRPATKFGKAGPARSINLLDPSERDLIDALIVFCRDGYSTIIIYLSKRGAK